MAGIGWDRLGLGEGDHRLSQAGRQAIPGYRRLADRLSQPDREKIMRVDADFLWVVALRMMTGLGPGRGVGGYTVVFIR